jgi:hypothetical protein
MAEAIKFTEQEVQSINELRQEVGATFTQLGQLSIQKSRTIQQLEAQEAQLLQKHQELVQKEQDLFKGLNEKYGDGNFDPATGEFTPTPNEEEVTTEG